MCLPHWNGIKCQGCGGYSTRNNFRTASVFYCLHGNSPDMSGTQRFRLLPHTCSAGSDAAMFASPLAEIEQDEPVLFELEAGLQGGLESERGWYRFDLVLAKTMQNQAKVLSTLCCGSHKHGFSDQPSYTPCRVGFSFPFLQSKHKHFHMNYYLFSLWSTFRNSYIWLLHKNCNLNMVFLWAVHKWLFWNVNYVVLVYLYIMEYSVVTSSDADIFIAAVFFQHWEHCHELVAMQNILKDKIPLYSSWPGGINLSLSSILLHSLPSSSGSKHYHMD